MNIRNSGLSLTHSNKQTPKSSFTAKFRSKLQSQHGEEALYSLQDERLRQIQDSFAKFDGDLGKLIGGNLKVLGPNWAARGPADYRLHSEDGPGQVLQMGLEGGEGLRLETNFKESQGRRNAYHRQILSRSGQGVYERQTPETIFTNAHIKDEVCLPVDELFGPERDGSLGDIYYRPAAEADSLHLKMNELKHSHRQELQKLGKSVAERGSESLKQLESEAFHLLHHPQNVADGLYRGRDFYVSPGHLQSHALSAGWDTEIDKQGQVIPIADAVVVGAGPGGLSTAHQLAKRGARVVTFEAELAGASFSDAGAKSVHHLRTTAYLTNLVRDGFDYITGPGTPEASELEHPASLLGRLEEYGELAKKGREAIKSLTDVEIQDIPAYPHGFQDTSAPATRGMFFAHLSKVADSVAQDFDDSFLCERSPVEEVRFQDGFYTVTTARGHKVKTKNLVVASGLTGSQGEHARQLPIFKNFVGDNPHIFENLSDTSKLPAKQAGPMLLQERSLGNQAVRQSVSALAEGSRAAMVGSGESALKGALELLQLNPGLSVDLFVKGPVDVAQVQIPPEYFFNTDAILATPNTDERARSETDRYGTPLTPRSLQLFLEYQVQGRARLLEMGEYFDENSIELSLSENSKVGVSLKSEQAKRNLAEGRIDFQGKELLPSGEEADYRYDILAQAVGYKPPAVDKLDFLKQLNLPEEAAEGLHINTTGAPSHQVQTTIPGLAISGRMIAQEIAKAMPEDRRESVEPKNFPGVRAWSYTSEEQLAEVPYTLQSGGLTESGYESVFGGITRGGEINYGQRARVVLTEYDRSLRNIYDKPAEERTPAEQETLDRGVRLGERMRGLHLPSRKEMGRLSEEGRLREVVENGPS